MKVRYIGKSYEEDELYVTGPKHGEIYDVISVEKGPADTDWYRIELEDDDDDGSGTPGYLYCAEGFEIIDDE